jgi:hypothetical protein
MKMRFFQAGGPFGSARCLLALICTLLLVPGDPVVYAQAPPQAAKTEPEEPKIPNDQLDSLVAPIALYPDPLLAQMLAASTYPLEIIQLQQWLLKHKNLKDKALVEAVQKENWDASVQGLAGLPDAVKQLSENIKWSTDLGNAFLAQQGDVMDAVQRMRAKAQGAGTLKSSEQQKVETKVVESKTVVVIEQTNPQVVYVPSYNPTVVYGPPVYPYPPIAYPPPGAYAATAAVSFGVGMMVGAAMSGGWGYNAGWGGGGNNTVNINNNNNFVNNSNKLTSAEGATTGSTMRSTAAAPPTQTSRQLTNSEERLAGLPRPHGRRQRARIRAGHRQVLRIAAAGEAAGAGSSPARRIVAEEAGRASVTGAFRAVLPRAVVELSGAVEAAEAARKPAVPAEHPA